MVKVLLIAGFVLALWMLGFAASNATVPLPLIGQSPGFESTR